jgi:hypothetical protein
MCWFLGPQSGIVTRIGLAVSRDEVKQPIALLGVCPIRINDPRGDIAVDQGTWRLRGIRMYTSHRLDRMTSNSASSHFDTCGIDWRQS